MFNRYASWYTDILFLTLVLGGLFFILLGSRPLFVPDEGRYAEIAREMVEYGNYVTPYLNGIKYFEKPILFYWLSSAAIKLLGLNLWSIRSINALLGLLGCLLSYVTARQLFDRTTGLLSALILGTSVLYFIMAHMISLDLTVTVFLAASLYSFLLGIQQPEGYERKLFLWSASAAAALAVLTKGLIGIVFPIMVISTWILLMGEWRLLKRLYLPSCILIFFLITAPWHIIVGMHNPEFFYFYFIEQHFLRYTQMDVGHYQPIWFFIPCLILGFFPWSVFLPQTIMANLPRSWSLRHTYKTEIFLILWASLIFIFFSFSKSKLIPYILPISPPLAILVARYLAQRLPQKHDVGIRLGFICLVLFSIVIACTLFAFSFNTILPDTQHAKIFLSLAGLILITGALISCIYAYRNIYKATLNIILCAWIFSFIIIAAIPSIDARTILPLTNILQPMLKPGDDIITFNQYYQDLPFYLQRTVSILNWQNELSFGMKHQDTHEWMLDDKAFWNRWHGNKRVFVMMNASEYAQLQRKYPNENFYFLGKTLTNVLISNRTIARR